MPSFCSSTRCGPISTSRRSSRRSAIIRRASAASAADERRLRTSRSLGDWTGADRGGAACRDPRRDDPRGAGCRCRHRHVLRMDSARPRLGRGAGTSAASSTRLLPALALLWIRERDEHGLDLLIWVFIVTWSTDIGAYFAGRSIGRPKLAPSISPGKNGRGAVRRRSPPRHFLAAPGFWRWAWTRRCSALAPVCAAAAQGGDLFESGMKRRAGVKDSGAWLPGHGGVLDRLDGLVPVAVLTALAQLLGLT